MAPSPFDAFPELTVYDLGGGRFLLDDRDLDYSLVWELAELMAESEVATQEQMMAEGVGSGCGLWLSISLNSSSNVLLTLHNTRQGQSYTVWSLTNLALTNWVVETNVAGVSGDFTEALIAMGVRSNLFLKVTEVRDYQVDTNSTFTGLGYSETLQDPPDSMGAVGPNHFVELLNGFTTNATAIRVYTKSGGLVAQTNTLDFFRIGTNYPASEIMTDPRILYDHHAQRWVACAIDRDSGQVILAVSKTDSPTNLATGWTNCVLTVKRVGLLTDFTTLAMDDNGVYVSVLHFGSTNAGHTVVALKKPEIYDGIFITNRLENYTTNTPPVWTIQPAVNFDDVTTNGFAWFVAKGPPDLSMNYQGGAIYYRRLQWSGTNAAWAETNWIAVSNTTTTYRDYYDLDGTNTSIVPSWGTGINAPNKDGTPIDLHVVGSRLAMTVIRNGFLWTCQAIGLSGTNGIYVGNETGTNVDRSGVQWLKLRIDAANGLLSYNAHGRVYDRSPTNADYYYFPSLMVNCTGDMVTGFSGSSATNYIGAYYSWRLAGGSTLDVPRVIRDGVTNYTYSNRWGDYSATTLDPTDDWSFWTVQQYVGPVFDPFDSHWETVISRITPNP